MVVLLFGTVWGHEFELLADAIRRQGSEPIIVDVDDWPSGKPLTQNVEEGRLRIGSETVAVEDVEGAFVKPNTLFVPAVHDKLHGSVSDDENPYASLTQLREYRGLFKSIVQSLEHHGATVVPTVDALVWEEMNPHACDRLDSIGVPVPESLATSNDEAAKRFVEAHGEVVYKPIAGVGGAHVLTEDDVDQLDGLTTPVLFQELIPGDDARAYVVDGEYCGAFKYTHDGSGFSFKSSEGDIGGEPLELPESVQQDLVRAVEASPTNYSGVDIRIREDGSYTLIEINSGGRFMLADSRGITNVADALAAYLTD